MLKLIFERLMPDDEETEDQDDRQEAEGESDPTRRARGSTNVGSTNARSVLVFGPWRGVRD